MIRIENLTKDYGEVRALNAINFEVKDGEVLGFLGPNGAGKSTTLRIITSYLAPTAGRVFVDDQDVTRYSMEVRSKIGYLPEQNPLYSEMTVYDFLRFISEARALDRGRFDGRLEEVADLCGLEGVIHKTIGELSKGYRQRVGLAQAIFHDPRIVILDEPTSGLDPNQIIEIRELIRNLGRRKTLIMSTHILQEVQATADRMIIINKGQIVAQGTTQELMTGFKGKTVLTLELLKATEETIRALPAHVSQVTVTESALQGQVWLVKMEFPNTIDPRPSLFDYAVKSGWCIVEMSRHKVSLEDVFRVLTVEGGAGRA
jgi:ABC-2 type transport system ATP-binding protein